MRALVRCLLLLSLAACEENPLGIDAGAVDAAPPASPDGGHTKMVEYDFGNQILRSALTIYADGAVERSEQICCPPLETPIAMPALTPAQLADLVADVDAIAATGTVESAGEIACEGCSSGRLVAYKNGVEHVVKTITLSASGSADVVVTSTAAQQADDVRTLVNGLVDRDMP